MKKSGIIIGILLVIIIALVVYIVKIGSNSCEKETTGNTGVLVLDDVNIEEDGKLSKVILKIKNTSSKVINNKRPVIIYYDNNNMPIHEAWGAKVGYFAPDEERCIMFYDVITEYAKAEVGFFETENEMTYTDLRDKVTFNVEKETELDENNEIRLNFKGENKYDKNVVATFEIDYYSDDKLIYSDEFIEVLDKNSDFNIYEYYATKFENGNVFPEGYTYKTTLVEAVEEIEESEDIEEVSDTDTDIRWDVLSDEEKIEHALFKVFKNNYGDKLEAAKIYVDKMYTPEEAKKKIDVELKKGEIAFEASIYFLPAEGADTMEFTIPDGEFDKESGWVKDVHRLGILTPDEDKTEGYTIRNLGTGW